MNYDNYLEKTFDFGKYFKSNTASLEPIPKSLIYNHKNDYSNNIFYKFYDQNCFYTTIPL